MTRDKNPLPLHLLPPLAIQLPTAPLQEGWQNILRRLDQANDWLTLQLRVEYAHAWSSALIQAQLIDVPTYRALGQARENLHEHVGQRIKEAQQ